MCAPNKTGRQVSLPAAHHCPGCLQHVQPQWTTSRGDAAECRRYREEAEISGAGWRSLGLNNPALQKEHGRGWNQLQINQRVTQEFIPKAASRWSEMFPRVHSTCFLLTHCVDEGRVEFPRQQWIRHVSEELLQQRSYVVDAVLLVQLYLPSLVKLPAKLEEILLRVNAIFVKNGNSQLSCSSL